jgi:hypothetical protein
MTDAVSIFWLSFGSATCFIRSGTDRWAMISAPSNS